MKIWSFEAYWAGQKKRKVAPWFRNLSSLFLNFLFRLGCGWAFYAGYKLVKNPFPVGRTVGWPVYTDYNTLYGLPLGNPFRPSVAILDKIQNS